MRAERRSPAIGAKGSRRGNEADLVTSAGVHFVQDTQRAVVSGARTDGWGQAANSFQVVVENIRLRRQDRIEGLIPIIKIGRQHFDRDYRVQLAHLVDGFAKVSRATIG